MLRLIMMDVEAKECTHPMGRMTKIFLASLFLLFSPWEWAHGQDSGDAATAASSQEQEGQTQDEAEDAAPRVRRLGDVEGEDFEFSLGVPQTARPPEPPVSLSLGEENLDQRLQQALAILAISENDRQALAEVEAVLNEALARADRLAARGDYSGASDVLNAIRQVEPNKEGLSEAWTRLADAEKETSSSSASPAYPDQDWASEKTGTVRPENTYKLPNAAQAERLDQLLTMIAARPNSQAALAELDALLDDLLVQAKAAINQGEYEKASFLVETVRNVNPRKRELAEIRRTLSQSQEVDEWLEAARVAEQEGALIEPRLGSAYYHYRRVLSVSPQNQEAVRGIEAIQQVMVVYALDASRNLDFDLADAWLEEASGIQTNQTAVEEGRRQIQQFRNEMAAGIEEEIINSIRAGDNNMAEFRLIDLIALGGYEERVQELRAMMTQEESYGQFEPGQVLQDAFEDGSGFAPAVVVITSGSFVMGSRPSEKDSSDNETPAHRVTFERGFALGQQEVTVGQFAEFVRATGYRTDAERSNEGSVWDEDMGQLSNRSGVSWRMTFSGETADDNLPVLHVSWNDATAYVQWLANRTGHSYRLPSEAEFEYAIRAGSRSAYWWGEGRPREDVENLAGSGDQSESGRRFSNAFKGHEDDYFGPAPVGSFSPNSWGIYDLAGNVSEWIQDCWHANYLRAPSTGVAWDNPGCDRRVVRGGYWASAPRQARSATRMSAPAQLKAPQLGFRVARDLW